MYNPLEYAWELHEEYIERFVTDQAEVLFLGMNPGPWGMAQTGVPFGEVETVREWFKIQGDVRKPTREHPKRPIQGLACPRSEVSGRRLWGLFRDRYGTPKKFACHCTVMNYCPLVFMEASSRNVTPDKIVKEAREELTQICDRHLSEVINILAPKFAIGVGAYAEKALLRVLQTQKATSHISPRVGKILHPSPASPAANRDWAGTATKQLVALGVWK